VVGAVAALLQHAARRADRGGARDAIDAEGQQVALNVEVTLPAFQKHYGYKLGDPVIAFFQEHAAADAEHSGRQLALTAKYVNTPELAARAMWVAEEACRLRWASITDLYQRRC